MTNGDKIRQMTNEELAELMNDEPCPPMYRGTRCPEERNCLECWAEWLKMEAEETGNMKVSARGASASVALTDSKGTSRRAAVERAGKQSALTGLEALLRRRVRRGGRKQKTRRLNERV